MHRIAALITRAHGSLALVAAIATASTISLAADPPARVTPPAATRSVTSSSVVCQGPREACIAATLKMLETVGGWCAWNADHSQCVIVGPRPHEPFPPNLRLDDVRKGAALLNELYPDLRLPPR